MDKKIILGEMGHSKLVINNGSITIDRNTKLAGKETTGIIYIMKDVSIELGRKVEEFIDALNKTRIPIIVQRTVNKGLFETYKVTRINTGNVPNVELGIIESYNGFIVGYIFNKISFENKDILKYVKPSALNSLCITSNNNIESTLKTLLATILKTKNSITSKKISRSITLGVKTKIYKKPIIYKFILGDNNKYTVSSVSLHSSAYLKQS